MREVWLNTGIEILNQRWGAHLSLYYDKNLIAILWCLCYAFNGRQAYLRQLQKFKKAPVRLNNHSPCVSKNNNVLLCHGPRDEDFSNNIILCDHTLCGILIFFVLLLIFCLFLIVSSFFSIFLWESTSFSSYHLLLITLLLPLIRLYHVILIQHL